MYGFVWNYYAKYFGLEWVRLCWRLALFDGSGGLTVFEGQQNATTWVVASGRTEEGAYLVARATSVSRAALPRRPRR